MCVLMGLGLFTSIAAIVRTRMLQEYYIAPDTFRSSATITLYAVIEQHLVLMAATVPTLKSFMETTLVRAGLWFYDEKSEGHVRGELVKLGRLDEGESLAKDEEKVARRVVVGTRVTKTQTSCGKEKIGELGTRAYCRLRPRRYPSKISWPCQPRRKNLYDGVSQQATWADLQACRPYQPVS